MVAKFELIKTLDPVSEPQTFVSEEISGLKILVKPTEYKKCERCWQRKPEVGTLPNPELCERCYQVVSG
jgi:isoleucyl-tRNA synthetase